MTSLTPISLHGGHSGQFCSHAKDRLEDLIKAYIDKGFPVVGISEHMPPPDPKFLYPDEIAQGLGVDDLQQRFARYFAELDRLKAKYQDYITIYRAFETETVAGAFELAADLIHRFRPDYIVGSVHHINDVCFDFSKDAYDGIAKGLGSVAAMYHAYFDAQFEMIQKLRPFVVGHFDIIRIYDPQYEKHLAQPGIQDKIRRNLELIQDLGLVLDYNLRPLARGEKYPYLAPVILEQAKELDIPVVPGDDAHSKTQAGAFVERAVHTLHDLGFSTCWPKPRLLTPLSTN